MRSSGLRLAGTSIMLLIDQRFCFSIEREETRVE
jgi:hypothetical protein